MGILGGKSRGSGPSVVSIVSRYAYLLYGAAILRETVEKREEINVIRNG